MASSYHSKVRSTQNKGVTFLLFGTWTLSFPHAGAQTEFFQGGEVSWNYGTSTKT